LRRVCASALAISLFTSQVAWADPNIGDAQVVVNDVKGTVGPQETVLRAGIDVFQNEVIHTGPRSASRVLFQDKTNLSIGASSQVTLDRFVYDPDPAKSAVALSIAKGVARFTTGNLPKSSYRITTPTATIGVRGTIITITVADDGTTTISVDEGVATVTSNGQTVEVNAGMTTTTVPGQPPSQPHQTATSATPPVSEMDFLLGDNALPAGPPGGEAPHTFILGATPLTIGAVVITAVIVAVAASSGSSASTTGAIAK
jgi:hypothetical protein